MKRPLDVVCKMADQKIEKKDTNKRKISSIKLAFIISVIYVGLGTWYAYYETINAITDGFLFFFFLPVSIFPTIILFNSRNPWILIIIIQLLTAIFATFIFWGFVIAFRKDK